MTIREYMEPDMKKYLLDVAEKSFEKEDFSELKELIELAEETYLHLHWAENILRSMKKEEIDLEF